MYNAVNGEYSIWTTSTIRVKLFWHIILLMNNIFNKWNYRSEIEYNLVFYYFDNIKILVIRQLLELIQLTSNFITDRSSSSYCLQKLSLQQKYFHKLLGWCFWNPRPLVYLSIAFQLLSSPADEFRCPTHFPYFPNPLLPFFPSLLSLLPNYRFNPTL